MMFFKGVPLDSLSIQAVGMNVPHAARDEKGLFSMLALAIQAEGTVDL